MLVNPTDSVDNGRVISICYASENTPANKKNNDATVIRYLESYFGYFDCHDTRVTVDPFDEFLDYGGYHFSSVQDPFDSNTIDVDIPDKFLDTGGSPFY